MAKFKDDNPVLMELKSSISNQRAALEKHVKELEVKKLNLKLAQDEIARIEKQIADYESALETLTL